MHSFLSPEHILMELKRRSGRKEAFPDLLIARVPLTSERRNKVLDSCRGTPAGRRMKIFVLGESQSELTPAACLELGANDCVDKNLGDDRLEASIRRVLGQQAA